MMEDREDRRARDVTKHNGRRGILAALMVWVAVVVGGGAAPLSIQAQVPAGDLPQTGAERAGWERTTTHAEVMEFLWEVQARTDRMLVQELTVTNEGRPHPVVFLGDPPLSEPTASLLSGKPTLFIVSTIHGNERSGKEGGQQFIRELTLGDHQDLLEHVNVIIVPHMNPDGGDAGRRQNSLGYDMNRDWIVAETREVTAVVEQILNRFAPDVFVDAHNGGSYPYHMTYQATLDPTADQALVDFARGPMYEYIKGHIESQDMRMYWYSGPSFDEDADIWFWRTTVPWPRKQHSYGGLRNMITLLYEVPGRHSLEIQADAARESMIGLARFMAENSEEVRGVVQEARRRTVQEPAEEVYFDLEPTAYPEAEEFYVVERDDEGEWMEPQLVTGENRTLYVPTRTRAAPYAYAFDARFDDVALFLRRHGIQVEELREEVSVDVERYRIESVSWADEPYQNHLMADIEVELVPDRMTLPAGSYLVRVRQHEGRLIPQLLEPDAVDSVVRWNFLDHVLPTSGGEDSFVPIYRLGGPVGASTLLVP
jgi:dipeptidyl-peptidase 4